MIQPDDWPIADALRTVSPLTLTPAQTPASRLACWMKSRAAGCPDQLLDGVRTAP